MATIFGVGLTITVHEAASAVTVVVKGDVDDANVGAFSAALQLASAGSPHLVIVDCSQLNFAGSCAVRACALAAAQIGAHGDLRVQRATPGVQRAFERTGNAALLAASSTGGKAAPTAGVPCG